MKKLIFTILILISLNSYSQLDSIAYLTTDTTLRSWVVKINLITDSVNALLDSIPELRTGITANTIDSLINITPRDTFPTSPQIGDIVFINDTLKIRLSNSTWKPFY